MNSNLSSFENDPNAPDNVGDSNLSESLADMDLDPSSSSEDKRSREDSEAAAEETDQSSPPTKRQRREDEDEEADKNAFGQQEVIEEDGDGSQQRLILIDDVDHSEDVSQQHETVQDDAEIGSSLDNNVNSSPDDERNNEEPLPLRPANTGTNTNSPSPVASPAVPSVSPVASSDVSMAEGSMISIDIPPDPNLPPLITPEEASLSFAASFDHAQDEHGAALLEFWARRDERNRRRNNMRLDRWRARRSHTPRPVWMTGIRNQPNPRSFVTGMEYLRYVLSELYELSDDEEW